MNWPQWTIGAWLALACVLECRAIVQARKSAVLRLVVLVAGVTGLAYVLHEGGFW